MNGLALVSAALMLLTAAMHSAIGEARLIRPMFRIGSGVLAVPFARTVLRCAWHFTSVLMLLTAATVAWPGTPAALLTTIGLAYLLVGLADAVVTRGRHVGWPFLAAAGACALAA